MGKIDQWVIWPAYLDATKSRSQGRMVPQKDAVIDPKLEEMTYAAVELGLSPEVERDKRFPAYWYDQSGRVLVAKKEPKSSLVKKIAQAIKKRRR
jgi:signal recognition particle subunit SRP19